MRSEDRPFVLAFLGFLAYALLHWLNSGLFIIPFFLAAPLCFVIIIYLSLRLKVITWSNILLALAMLGFALKSQFIPIVFGFAPDYSQSDAIISIVVIAAAIVWISAHFLFAIAVFKRDPKKTILIVLAFISVALLLVLPFFATDFVSIIVMHIAFLLFIVLKTNLQKLKKNTAQVVFCNAVLLYFGLTTLHFYLVQ